MPFMCSITTRNQSTNYLQQVDYTLFNNTYEVETPLNSSKELDELKAEFNTTNGLGRS